MLTDIDMHDKLLEIIDWLIPITVFAGMTYIGFRLYNL